MARNAASTPQKQPAANVAFSIVRLPLYFNDYPQRLGVTSGDGVHTADREPQGYCGVDHNNFPPSPLSTREAGEVSRCLPLRRSASRATPSTAPWPFLSAILNAGRPGESTHIDAVAGELRELVRLSTVHARAESVCREICGDSGPAGIRSMTAASGLTDSMAVPLPAGERRSSVVVEGPALKEAIRAEPSKRLMLAVERCDAVTGMCRFRLASSGPPTSSTRGSPLAAERSRVGSPESMASSALVLPLESVRTNSRDDTVSKLLDRVSSKIRANTTATPIPPRFIHMFSFSNFRSLAENSSVSWTSFAMAKSPFAD